MIEVNLLPEDRRPVERTPLPRFLTILGGVIGFCIEGIFVVFLLTLIPQKRGYLESLILRKERAQKEVNSVKEIEKEIAQIAERKKGVEKLQNDRRLWAPILYRLCDPDMLPARVWFEEIGLKKERGGRGKAAVESLEIDALASASDDDDGAARYTTAMTFIRSLKLPHPQFSEYFTGEPSLGQMKTVSLAKSGDDVDAPGVALSFSVTMPMRAVGAGPAKKK